MKYYEWKNCLSIEADCVNLCL